MYSSVPFRVPVQWSPRAARVAHIYIDDKGRKDILVTIQDNTDVHGKPSTIRTQAGA